MAAWIEISGKTLDHHFQQKAKGKTHCMGYSTCMQPIIDSLAETDHGAKAPTGSRGSGSS